MSARSQHSVSLRRATEADIPFLVDLRRATMSQHEAAAGVSRSEEELLLHRVLARYAYAQIIVCSGTPVGLLKVIRDGAEWELLQIQLLPALQKAGIGTHLVRGVVAEARAAGASLRLSVLKGNPARSLYERLGFKGCPGESQCSGDASWRLTAPWSGHAPASGVMPLMSIGWRTTLISRRS